LGSLIHQGTTLTAVKAMLSVISHHLATKWRLNPALMDTGAGTY
jgi:hypothetical protein